jgi:hypothetical protein
MQHLTTKDFYKPISKLAKKMSLREKELEAYSTTIQKVPEVPDFLLKELDLESCLISEASKYKNFFLLNVYNNFTLIFFSLVYRGNKAISIKPTGKFC